MKCQVASSRKNFQRCANCASAYYCSVACQRADWGSLHKHACKYFEHQGGTDIAKRDKAFLRFILHHDYTHNRTRVLSLHAQAMSHTTTHSSRPITTPRTPSTSKSCLRTR
ncbi:hypothetical protein C8F04DRAFT_92455 [Mycena alexandri]|uniref:MYND-type domain-containing protein n=1 Tax=Mycena alexandri TaxID=1745969 RepID=A0AAD6WWL5_9AGAR|nr:hypothetical protein C8F04DRAFT_92455 [Mycena alexandri]